MSVEVKWLRQDATINTTADDDKPSIAYDAAGNTYVSYTSDGTSSGGTRTGSYDIVVFKLDANGNRVWLTQNETINTTADDYNQSIACDAAGNTYVSYMSSGTSSGGTLTGSSDIVVFKLDASGNRVWLTQNETINTTADDQYPSIACDAAGNTYVSYMSSGTSSGGTQTGSTDIVVFKLDANGNRVWLTQNETINTTADDQYPSIACDAAGNAYVSYMSLGTSSGGTQTGSTDIIVFKLDANGNRVWLTQNETINTTADDYNQSIACDAAGNTYVSYTSLGTSSGGTRTGSTDIIVFKLDANGNRVWLTQNETINTTADDQYPSIACDAAGNTYVSYSSAGTSSGGTQTGSSDIVVFKLDASGNRVWLTQNETINNTAGNYNPSIACDAAGNTYVSYSSAGTSSGGTHTGNFDIIVFKLGPPPEPVPCFLGDARVLTPCGYVAINRLKPGHPVVTADGRIVPIKRCVVTVSKSSAPYIIPAGQFGCRWPLGISGAHRIFPDSYVFRDCWNPIRDMKAVRDIAGLPRMPVRGNIRWYNLQLPDYYRDTLIVNGVIAESLRH